MVLKYGSRTFTHILRNSTIPCWLLGPSFYLPHLYRRIDNIHRVLTILLPTAFFASLDRGAQSVATNGIAQYSGALLTDLTRDKVLRMSRGLAVVLLLM